MTCHGVMVECSRSTDLEGWKCHGTCCSPSICPRISTVWSNVGCSRTVVDNWLELRLMMVRRSPILPAEDLSWGKWSGEQLDLHVVDQDVLDGVEKPSVESPRWLGFVVWMCFCVSWMWIVVWMTGVFVVMTFVGEGCDEPRLDVCPDVLNGIDGGVIWNGVVKLEVALQVESRELEEVGLEWVDV